MKDAGKQPQGPDGGARARAPLEGLRRFVAARFVLSPYRARGAVRSKNAPATSQAFSREVAGRSGRMLTTDALSFIRSLFGREPSAVERPGLKSDLIYREPDRTLRQSFHNWYAKSVLSLTVNKLEQRFGLWLSRAPVALTPARPEHKPLPAAPTYRPVVREVFLLQPAPKEGAAPGGGNVSGAFEGSQRTVVYLKDASRLDTQVFRLPPPQTHQKTLRDVLGTNLINTLREFETGFGAAPGVAASVRATSPRAEAITRAAEGVREFVIHVFRRLTVPPLSARDAAWKTMEVYTAAPGGYAATSQKAPAGGAGIALPHDSKRLPNVGEPNMWKSKILLAHLNREAKRASRGTAESVARAHAQTPDAAMRATVTLQHVRAASVPTGETARGVQGARGRQRFGDVFSHTTFVPVRPADWFGQAPGAGLSFVRAETFRVGPEVSILLTASGGGVPSGADEDAPALPLNRELAARTVLAARTRRAYQPATAGRHGGPSGGFTFLRREEQLRPPAQSYAYAHTARPAPVEEPPSMRARKKEVEEIVRKDVAEAMKSRSPFDGLSRSDYSRLADRVYSLLARRLMIDRERSGLRR